MPLLSPWAPGQSANTSGIDSTTQTPWSPGYGPGSPGFKAVNTAPGSTPTPAASTPVADPKYGAPKIWAQDWDIHGQYNWALNLGTNNSDIRNYIPRIELEEYDLKSSSQLNAFKLFLSQTQSQLTLGGVPKTTTIGGSTSPTDTFASYIANKIIPNKTAVDKYIGEGNDPQPGGFDESDPYYGLYQGALTGNKYYLPYLNPQNMTSNLGGWKGIDGSDIASSIAKIAGTRLGGLGLGLGNLFKGSVEEFQKLGLDLTSIGEVGNVTSSLAGVPGISKETIKVFTPNETGDVITSTFYLFNTERVEQMQNNWDFLFTLTYQNLPNRKSLSRMDPPCIYTVTVPGFKRFPVAVISNLKVENLGTTRLVDITTGEMVSFAEASNNSNIKIIPEAYRVTVTIQSLLTNTRNLFYYGYDNKAGANIKVITVPDSTTATKTEAKTAATTAQDTAAEKRLVTNQSSPGSIDVNKTAGFKSAKFQ
jgi:hypothetical protein